MARSLCVILLVVMWTTGQLHGQEVAGALEGRVLDGASAALEGAEVVVEGGALQGARDALTDARGRFIMRSLPVGAYTVRIRRIGYGPIRIQEVPVRLGSTTSLGDVPLVPQPQEIAEIVVSGAKPVIDPVSAAAGFSLDSAHFLSLPAERDFRALIAFAPQANASIYGDGANIGGSTGLENAFYVDGMHVTVAGGSSINLPFNFVREIQVITGGYEAEYGRALSGVVNVVTPSGGNEFHGQVLGFFTSDELRTTPRVGLAQAEPGNFTQYDLGLSLSGPILRDRLWFFAAYDPTVANQDASLAALTDQRDHQLRHQVAGKLTWRAGPATDAALTFIGDPFHHDVVVTDILPLTTTPEVALGRERGGGTTVGAQVRHELDSRTQLDFAVSRLDRRSDFGPASGSTGPDAFTRIDDFTANASSGGLGFSSDSRESRTALRIAATAARGRHTVKVGAEYEVNSFSTESRFSLVSRSDINVYDWIESIQSARVRNRVPTLYAQDGWQVNNRLRVNAGLRWEAQHMSGETGPNRTIGTELAPRFAVVYMPGEVGSQRVTATAGRFFEQVPPFGLSVWNGNGTQLVREFPQNPLTDSTNGVVLTQFDFGTIPATEGLVGQYYDQLSLGYERRVGQTLKLGARGVYRTLRWAIEDGVAPGDSVYRMGNPGRGVLAAMPRARQRYAALELSLERATPGPLYFLASYVLSRNVGNYTGLFGTELLQMVPNSGPQYDIPDLLDNAYGLLPNDRTHVVKMAASYRTRFGGTLGGFLTVASGTPRSEQGTSIGGFPYLTFVEQRGSSGRTPTVWSLDLHASYDLPVAQLAHVRPRLVADVFNVGSPRHVLLYEQRHFLDDSGAEVNPNFGAVTQYQPPMSARVGMVVGF